MSGRVWFGFTTKQGQIIADPFEAFRGRLDKPNVKDTGEALEITISYESRLIELLRSKDRRYTHEDQQIRSPGDKGFEFVSTLQDTTIALGQF
jgi:hypothetical protein